MSKKLIPLLAAAVLGKFVMPAAAQAPEAGAFGLPWRLLTAVRAGPACKSADALDQDIDFTSVLWTKYRWSCDGARWVEIAAAQGPIAMALGLAAPAAPDGRDVIVAVNGCEGEPGGRAFCIPCFAELLSPDSLFRIVSARGETAPAVDIGQPASWPMASVLGLPGGFSEQMVSGCAAPPCAINWMDGCPPALQFGAGGSVCLSAFGVSGLGGHQGSSECIGTGVSVWLGCTMPSGLEILASFHYFGGQQISR